MKKLYLFLYNKTYAQNAADECILRKHYTLDKNLFII